MGVALYRMVTGKAPFFSSDINELLESIRSAKFTFPDFLSNDIKDLISKILKLEPNERLSLSSILSHPWLSEHKTSNPSLKIFSLDTKRSQFQVNDLVNSLKKLDIVVVNATSSATNPGNLYCKYYILFQ